MTSRSNERDIDVILIGHNHKDFNESVLKTEPYKSISGGFDSLALQGIRLSDGRYYSYFELLNMALRSLGEKEINCFDIPSYSLVNIANQLQKNGLHTEIINTFNCNKNILTDLLIGKPKLVVITTTFYTGDDGPIIEIVEFIRKINSRTLIVTGGPRIYKIVQTFSSRFQDATLTKIGSDYYIVEQLGITSLVLLTKHFTGQSGSSLEDIPNLIIKQNDGNFFRTHRLADPLTLDDSTIDWKNLPAWQGFSATFMQTKKGCPFRCSFCTYHKLGTSVDQKSLHVIENEMQALKEIGVKHIVFSDDSFNIPNNALKNLCRMMLKNKFNFSWTSFLRVSNLDDEALDLMAQSGCTGVVLGIESGDQTILDKMNKKASVDLYRKHIKRLNELCIPSIASIIVGHPGETECSIRNTVSFIEEVSPTFFVLWLYYHDPLSDLHAQRKQYNIEGKYYSWKHDTMDWKEALSWQKFMIKNIHNSCYLDGSLSFFSEIPLLNQQGFSIQKIKEVGQYLKTALLNNHNSVILDFDDTISEIARRLTN